MCAIPIVREVPTDVNISVRRIWPSAVRERRSWAVGDVTGGWSGDRIALGVCVAMAVASGSKGLEAAVVLTPADAVAEEDLAALRDLGGTGVVVHRGDVRGTVAETLSS